MVKITERLGDANGGQRGHHLLPGSLFWLILATALAWSGVAPIAATPAPGFDRTDLDRIAMTVAFDPSTRTLDGAMRVDWINDTGQVHRFLPFRLYPNAPYYDDGSLTVNAIRVDGVETYMQLSFDPTVIEVDLGAEVAPGDTVTLDFDFTTQVPRVANASFGILAGDRETGWRLADWYPTVAGWEDGGWYLAPPTSFGDPTFPRSSTWDVSFTAPDDLVVVGTGNETVLSSDPVAGTITTRLVAGPARDMALTLLPGDPEIRQEETGDGAIRVVTPDDSGFAEVVSGTVGDGMSTFSDWMGPYPADGLDIVFVPLAGAPAVSWSGLIWVDPDRFAGAGDLDRLRFTLLHEVAHQWIPGIAGSNNNDHGFMSEGLANTLAVLVARDRYGLDAGRSWLERYVAAGYQRQLERGRDGVADTPLADGTDIGTRNALVYGKAALGFEAIRQHIGHDAFLAGLMDYVATFRDRNSGPADLQAAWETASGRDLDDLWEFWFEDATATPEDVEQVLAGFG